MDKKELTQSLEDYLEAILHLENIHRVARVKDIASELNVKMPSVTGALKILKQKGHIEYEKNSYITLTESGKEIAEKINKKHQIMNNFFINIFNTSEEDAGRIACEIEHIIDMNMAKKFENLSLFLVENHGDLIQNKKWTKMLELSLK